MRFISLETTYSAICLSPFSQTYYTNISYPFISIPLSMARMDKQTSLLTSGKLNNLLLEMGISICLFPVISYMMVSGAKR